jgi:hypothetical protein
MMHLAQKSACLHRRQASALFRRIAVIYDSELREEGKNLTENIVEILHSKWLLNEIINECRTAPDAAPDRSSR